MVLTLTDLLESSFSHAEQAPLLRRESSTFYDVICIPGQWGRQSDDSAVRLRWNNNSESGIKVVQSRERIGKLSTDSIGLERPRVSLRNLPRVRVLLTSLKSSLSTTPSMAA